MRYSLLSLFGFMAFCGIALGALAAASYLLASLFFSLTIAVLCGAVVGATVMNGAPRAFWLAFSVFGWTHFVLALGPWFDDHTGEFLFSRHCIDWLGSAMNQKVADHTTMPGIWHNLPFAASSQSYRFLAFVVIGQSVFTLGLAWISGLVASYFFGFTNRLATGSVPTGETKEPSMLAKSKA